MYFKNKNEQTKFVKFRIGPNINRPPKKKKNKKKKV